MRFTKMHGAGNDYVYVDCFREPMPDNPAELARRISDRHFGVGSDGLVLICPSEKADARMRMFNADGSEAEMCGNAIRCVAKYLFERGIAHRPTVQIETGRGILTLELETAEGVVQRVRVDMGEPILEPDRVPTTLPGNPAFGGAAANVPLRLAERTIEVTCVSMGNPHCVTFVEQLDDTWVHQIGRQVETNPHFPRRTNAEFVQILSHEEVRMRVWERGAGETLACGTGACAVCVAGAITGRTGRRLTVHLLGGDLEIHWAADNHVYMSGPAVEVFEGVWKRK